MTPFHPDPVWIDSDEKLRQCCDSLQGAQRIAVDTEFMRTSTFYPKAALFQLYAGETGEGHCYLVDPLAISDFRPLVQLLTDPSIVKIFHACSEDLEVFSSFLGCVPEPLADTQIAAALLGYGASLSYAALVEKLLGINLEKGETRSDWLQRPLASKQLQYAVQDVVYLLDVYEAVLAELDGAMRLPWWEEDCAALVSAARAPQDPDAFYPRIKQAWKLNREELAILRKLSYWRELRARQDDLPRNHVLHERTLWDLAKHQPVDLETMRRMEGMDARKLSRYGREVLALLAEAKVMPAADYPPLMPGPLPLSQRELMKALKAAVAQRVEELNIVPEVLARKSDYEFIVRTGMEGEYQLPARLLGWRRAVVGESLLQLAEDLAGGSARSGHE